MSQPAILTRSLGKKYSLRHYRQVNYKTLREEISDFALGTVRSIFRPGQGKASSIETFWALQDLDLRIEPGEIVGIIGPNGAGKSTFLKILSRIVEPTVGRADIYGRVASLLEVGTGFHPELTGRENVFLNGAILGMSRQEIRRKFDAIVEFAGVEKFLDTPVKHYSSGMYVRLAFSVAAHLDPDVLIVDEVLAVGDARFQKKCIDKMQDVARGSGRTIVFVSHNMAVVQAFCERGIYLQQGRLQADGPISSVVPEYLRSIEKSASLSLRERSDRLGLGENRLEAIEIEPEALISGGRARLHFHFAKPVGTDRFAFIIYDMHGLPLCHFNSFERCPDDDPDLESTRVLVWDCPNFLLLPGRYRINTHLLRKSTTQDQIEGACIFDVHPGHLQNRPLNQDSYGRFTLTHYWKRG